MNGSNALRRFQHPAGGRGRAFTLIELLVVISILTFLMALLLPVVHRARKQAQGVVCMAQLRQCGVLLATRADEYDGKLVDATEAWSLFREACGAEAGETVSCPAAPPLPATNDPLGSSSMSGAAWWVANASYGYNDHLAYELPGRVGRPAKVPLVCDAMRSAMVPGHYDEPPAYDGDCWGPRGNCPHMRFVCINRHQGGVNMLFLDWSARKVGLKELWMLKWSEYFETNGPWTKAGGALPEDWPQWLRKFKDY